MKFEKNKYLTSDYKMASVKIENIKNLIKIPKPPLIKPPIYHSIFSKLIKREHDAKKDCHKTMGYSEIKINPKQFLKKNTRKVKRPFVEITVPTKSEKKATIPEKHGYCVNNVKKQTAIGAEKTKSKKNFVRLNIIDAIRKVPPLPKERIQDTKNGHVILLNEAGLKPIYTMKKGYGEIPAYLKKKHKAEEAARLAERERLQSIKLPYRLLSDDERKELLKGLKTNWMKQHEEFLRLPMITDTIVKLKKKTMMEKELAQLESDIAMLEKYESTYVFQDA